MSDPLWGALGAGAVAGLVLMILNLAFWEAHWPRLVAYALGTAVLDTALSAWLLAAGAPLDYALAPWLIAALGGGAVGAVWGLHWIHALRSELAIRRAEKGPPDA